MPTDFVTKIGNVKDRKRHLNQDTWMDNEVVAISLYITTKNHTGIWINLAAKRDQGQSY